MRHSLSFLLSIALLFFAVRGEAQNLFDIPLRINMGGVETEDSHGNIWLGDLAPGLPCGGDPLDIRVNDSGGCNFIENWLPGTFQPDSLDEIGFDSTHPGDQYIFNTIRWDVGNDGIDFRLEIPVENGQYIVNCYFTEQCCPGRHFQIEIQGEIVADDVSYLSYADPPSLGRVGRLSFPGIEVNDQLLRIAFLPCPQCPGATDTNAIIDAIEVLGDSMCTGPDFNFRCSYDPVADRVNAGWNGVPGADSYRVLKNGQVLFASLPGTARSFTDANPRSGGTDVTYVIQALDGGVGFAQCSCRVRTLSCPRNLRCSFNEATVEAALNWDPAVAVDVTGYEVRANGILLATLPGNATSYIDRPSERRVAYEVLPLTAPAGQCRALTCNVENPTILLPVPFRVNAGGPEVTDSRGRLWRGDQGPGDPLDIRPVDTSATQTIEAWCNPSRETVEALGFDFNDPNDVTIFRSIRWDVGGDADDFIIELPVPNDEYIVNLYFCEACCDNRHFKIEIEGEIVADDVHRADYASAHHQVGRYSFEEILVTDRKLTIGLLPCRECPGATDVNAILSALEVMSTTVDCGNPKNRECPGSLSCSVDGAGMVTGTWQAPRCLEGDVTGYRLLRDGEQVATLPATATSFIQPLGQRVATYEVVPLLREGSLTCRPMRCTAINPSQPFAIPLRINMGGQETIDSRGRRWLGDPGAGQDVLAIRPDVLGGTNAISNWCDQLVVSNFDSLQSLGFDPFHPGDLHIFDTIRWDIGDDDGDFQAGELNDLDGGDVDFILELPVPNGNYLVNLYFTECCCPTRHFSIEIQDELLIEDVNAAAYSPSGDLGRTGFYSFDGIAVTGGILRIALRPCISCPGASDFNAILNALEVLPAAPSAPRCPQDLNCFFDLDGSVTGNWGGPENLSISGYRLLRNGEPIATLPAGATTFNDAQPPCTRTITYELEPMVQGSPCPGLRLLCTVVDPFCMFEVPLRVNMGGRATLDSNGDLWHGDPGESADVLGMRRDLLGGQHAPEYWGRGAYQRDTLTALGFDPPHQGNEYIFTTIRWDVGNNPPDFLIDIPIEDGAYTINMYFEEGCCPGRHFQITVEDELVAEDVSYLSYVPAAPALGKVGVLSFEAVVKDEVLNIGLLPCGPALCPGSTDTNAIINGLEILPSGGPPLARFVRGDANSDGTINLTDGVRILNFLFTGGTVPECMDAADSDDSGGTQLSITDAIRILGWLFSGGTAPPPPTPSTGAYPTSDCGPDPTPDSFDCAVISPKCR
jgi:hypothetical protein